MSGHQKRQATSLGVSGHRNEYRRGVLEGHYGEELLAADAVGRPGFVLDRGGAFSGVTTAAATYTAAGKSGAELAAASQRDDIRLKYGKYGKSQALPEDKTGFWATTAQLAFEEAGGAASAAAPGSGGSAAAGPTKVHECLWGASKHENRKVPVSAAAYTASAERRRQLEAEAAASPYRTVEKDCLEAAARDEAARRAARPPMARPHDPAGEDTQTGRKPVGECAKLFDKDWQRTGLRKK